MEWNKTEWGRKLPKKWIENQYLSHMGRAHKSNVVCKCQQLSDVEVMSFRAILYLYLWQQDKPCEHFIYSCDISGFCLNVVFTVSLHVQSQDHKSQVWEASSVHSFKSKLKTHHFLRLDSIFDILPFPSLPSALYSFLFFFISLMLLICHYFQTFEACFVMFGCNKRWLD